MKIGNFFVEAQTVMFFFNAWKDSESCWNFL